MSACMRPQPVTDGMPQRRHTGKMGNNGADERERMMLALSEVSAFQERSIFSSQRYISLKRKKERKNFRCFCDNPRKPFSSYLNCQLEIIKFKRLFEEWQAVQHERRNKDTRAREE